MKLTQPLNDNAEVLRSLIIKGKADCIQFSWMEGFRTRVSNLKRIHRIKSTFELKTKVNRHGNTISYRVHRLIGQRNIDHAIGVYLKINKKKAS